ncbi:MAG: HNH endonuclease family protein [Gammaproteobacteria bacterium]|nr:HNH endonuclease family protein [Gammaproteobacteria bacterium]
MGIDIHRPLTLRLLSDASESCEPVVANGALAKTLKGIGTWTTRIWLADRATAGLNKAVVEMAHGPGPAAGEDCTEYWLERIRRLRTTRVGVPNDEAVGEGIRTRKAYGGTATRSSFAVLCALMESERPDEAPARNRLTIEHVMPQKLTDEWRRALGADPVEKHERHRDRLPNLTLSGDATNPSLAARPFAEKRSVYRDSPIGMTRRIAEESDWDEEALEQRAADLTRRVVERWPWPEQGTGSETATFRWRIEGGPWHTDRVASQMVLNVAGALLSRDPGNATKLSGDAVSSNIHLASNYAPGSKVGRQSMRAVPGHAQYVIHPYERDYPKSAQRCRKMGERCGVSVEVELAGTGEHKAFWELLKEHVGGLPGQKEEWRGPHQRTSPANSCGDRIGIHVGNADMLWLYIRAGDSQESGDSAARMRQYSWMIREQMGDQQLGDDLEKNSRNGITILVRRQWTRDDQDEWPEAARWIAEQHERLRAILAGPSAGTEAVER